MKMKMCYSLKNQNQINAWALQFSKVVEKYSNPYDEKENVLQPKKSKSNEYEVTSVWQSS